MGSSHSHGEPEEAGLTESEKQAQISGVIKMCRMKSAHPSKLSEPEMHEAMGYAIKSGSRSRIIQILDEFSRNKKDVEFWEDQPFSVVSVMLEHFPHGTPDDGGEVVAGHTVLDTLLSNPSFKFDLTRGIEYDVNYFMRAEFRAGHGESRAGPPTSVPMIACALIYCVVLGRGHEWVEVLLKHGADVNQVAFIGDMGLATATDVAIKAHHDHAVQTLQARGGLGISLTTDKPIVVASPPTKHEVRPTAPSVSFAPATKPPASAKPDTPAMTFKRV